jgi:hypothetical protein
VAKTTQWGGVEAIRKKIVDDLTPTPGGAKLDRLTAMQKIGMPDQHPATCRQKATEGIATLTNSTMPMILKQALGVGFRINLLGVETQGFGAEIGKAMAAGVVNQGTTVRCDILERDPDPAHETQGIAMKMDGITMVRLLTSHSKVERLKCKWFTPV